MKQGSETLPYPTISLVIPAHNEEKYLAACLRHALDNSKGALSEIIVVDNASSDRTAEIAASFSGVRIVREEVKGLTRARQRGYLEAKGDIVAYIDADTLMQPEWCARIREEFGRDRKLVCLSGPFEYYDTSALLSVLVKTYWHVLALPAYLFSGYMVVGGNFAIRREALAKMDGFDTTIEFYGEDTDLARRAHKVGKVLFKTDFVVSTSARRLHKEGLFPMAKRYVSNYFSEVFWHVPATKEYQDIR